MNHDPGTGLPNRARRLQLTIANLAAVGLLLAMLFGMTSPAVSPPSHGTTSAPSSAEDTPITYTDYREPRSGLVALRASAERRRTRSMPPPRSSVERRAEPSDTGTPTGPSTLRAPPAHLRA